MNILFVGDIVGGPGREILQRRLPSFLEQRQVDFCVANGENSSGGSGMTPSVASKLFALPIHALTNGDHTYRRREILPLLQNEPRVVRPENFSGTAIGRGVTVIDAPNGVPVAVLNVIGRVFMNPADCPFVAVDRLRSQIPSEVKVILVDFHAEATSEKVAMGWHLDGKVSAVMGTHTHVQTADERVLPQGTAYITDAGMTGAHDSVIGRDKERVLHKFITGMPCRYDLATGDLRISGVLIDVDPGSGKARGIERVSLTDKDGNG